jgi:putative aminopeptidase FrvX
VSKEEAEALGIRPGDAIVPASSFEQFAHGRYVGKALVQKISKLGLEERRYELSRRPQVGSARQRSGASNPANVISVERD